MKLSAARTNELKQLLKAELDTDYNDVELERAAIAIMRFVLHKELSQNKTQGVVNDQQNSNERRASK